MPDEKQKGRAIPDESVSRDDDTIRSLPLSTGVSTNRALRTPSYQQSQYETVIRRQRIHNALKIPQRLYRTTTMDSNEDENVEGDSSYPPKTVHEWEFSGWGTMAFSEVSEDEVRKAQVVRENERRKAGEGSLGAWRAAGVAGVAVAGSPLYAFPALVGVAGIYSPISLLVATLLLSLWRPIMEELASAISIDGANYVYLLNTSAVKSVAIFGAAVTLLDDIATAVVSAGTAASYIATEASLPFNVSWLTVILLVAISLVGLMGIKGNAEVMTSVLIFHLVTVTMIVIAGAIEWSKMGNRVIAQNWSEQPGSAGGIARAIFFGVCVGFLGVTGFETAPDFASSVRPEVYPTVLRSLQYIAVCINAPTMLVTFAVLPMDRILGNQSVLSSVAYQSAGAWLRIWVSVDAVLILCATILTGVVSANALIGKLAGDGVFPLLFLRRLPRTGAPYLSIVLFTSCCLVIYGTAAGSLTTMSNIFAIVFLSIMFLFPVSLLLLTYARPSLPRSPRNSLSLSLFVLALSLTLIIGNIVLSPIIAGYLAAYVVVIGAIMVALAKRSRAMRVLWWFTDRLEWMGKRRWGDRVVQWMKSMRGGPIVLFVETDEIHRLFEMLSYVQQNEETSLVKVVHCYIRTEDIPSELEPNCKIIDEAFPAITVDLILLQGSFSPSLVDAFVARIGVEHSRCFVGAMSREFPYDLASFGGVRVVAN